MQEDLELQLHEQYAINNNANVSSFIAMIATLMVAFTGYGYVLYEYLMGDWVCMHSCRKDNATTMLNVATCAVLLVVCIIYVVAINIGYSQRSNQFVIHRIREKVYSKERLDSIYPAGYSPMGKNFITFIQGLYNPLSWILLAVYIAISLFSWVSTAINYCLLTISIIVLLSLLAYRWYKYIKYRGKRDCKSDNKCKLECSDWLGLCLFPICSVLICIAILLLCDCCAIRGFSVVMLVCSLLTIFSIYCYRQ